MNKLFLKCLKKITFFEAAVLQKQFIQAAKKFESTQQKVLLKKIKRAQNSEFGQKHQFSSIRSIQDFQQKVPLTTYEDMAPYIEKVKQGNVGALFHPKEKIVMYALSSGTTAEPKTIPVTPAFIKQYKQGSLLWGTLCAADHEQMLEGKILTIVSPAHEEETELGVACGAISGLIVENQKTLARLLYSVPGNVYEIKDTETKDYLLLRFSLAEKITFLTTANPSTLIRLAQSAEKFKEQLVQDIYEGTVTPPGAVPKEWLNVWREKMVPKRGEGIRLQNLIQKEIPFIPKNFWPQLALLACWKGGTLSSYLPQVRELYGEVPLRDLGLLASEGRMTVPIQDKGSAGVLDLMHHFFEFIPEAEQGKANPTLLMGHQLKKGERYFIVLTTSSGLYRYQIYDLVEVEDFFHQAPVLRFLNKGKSFSSITGEKLSEFQVVQAVQCAAMEHQIKMERFIMVPKWGEPPHYTLLVEEDFSVENKVWERFALTVEQELLKINTEYQSKRDSLRLAGLELQHLPVGTFKIQDAQTQKQRSGRQEQFKPSFLSNDLNYLAEYASVNKP